MPALAGTVDTTSERFRANRSAMLELLTEHDEQVGLALAGGGARYTERHHARGKLLARERVELLLDPDTAFLELSPVAAYGTQFAVGGSIVTGVGVVSGVECVIIAHDPTVRGGTMNPYTLRKNMRAFEISRINRLQLITLVE